jgi:hypothetical protein
VHVDLVGEQRHVGNLRVIDVCRHSSHFNIIPKAERERVKNINKTIGIRWKFCASIFEELEFRDIWDYAPRNKITRIYILFEKTGVL